MKRFVVVFVLLLALTLSVAAQVSSTLKAEQHKATLTIIITNGESEHAGCSATAIAPHVILTAEHCDIENGTLYLNQNQKPFTMGLEVKEKYYDNNDHMLLVVPGAEFKHFAKYNASEVRTAKQGEHIYFYGNPNLIKDQYREGYASGTMHFNIGPEDKLNAAGPFTMFAVSVVGGDSGSAIFSDVDGQLIGITTWGLAEGKFLGSYPLQFTQDQINQAEGLGNFVYVPDTRSRLFVKLPKPVIVNEDTKSLTELFALFMICYFFPLFYRGSRKVGVYVIAAIKNVRKFRVVRK
jgi:hypothetical protein